MLRVRLLALSITAAITCSATAQRYVWREVTPAARPTGRSEHGMVYDQARGVVLMFGGKNASGAYLNDTWQYDGTTWTELHPATTPPPRGLHAMAYDPVRERVVVFGGYNGAVTGDVWEWDGSDWTQFGGYNGILANLGAACYVPTLGGILYSRESTNMVWDGTSWRYLTVPNAYTRYPYQQVYNPMLGGAIACLVTNDTVRFDLQQGWTPVFPQAPIPSYGAMACDPMSGRMVLQGGIASSYFGTDTWVSSGTGWTRLAQTIPGREWAPMAYDPGRRRFVLFGGYYQKATTTIYRDDTWEMRVYDEPATWTAYGQGCGSPPAQLEPDPWFGSRPVVGGDLTMLATQVPAGQPFVHSLGASDSLWLGLSLPLSLAPIGAPGCALLAAPEFIEDVGTSGSAGSLRFTIRIPDNLDLIGGQFFHQVIGLAPGLNPAGLIVTNGGAGTFGAR